LAAFYKGQYYVTGRLKDLIIINGANFFPSDIEECATLSHPDIRPGCVVAVSLTREVHQSEGLAVIVELKDKPQSSASSSSSSSKSGKIKLSKDDIAMAQKIFKQTAKLPTIMRGPAIRGLARLGAWWTKDSAKSKNDEEKKIADGESNLMGYNEQELINIERTIRSAILSTFGLPAHDVIIAQPVS